MKTVLLKIRKMASDYLPGVYTRIGTEENPGTFRGGSGSGISNSMPPITVKPWVLKNDKWNMRGYWISGGIFNIPPVWLMDNGIWNNSNVWLSDGIWRMNKTLFSDNDIWNNEFVWIKDLIWKL